MVALSWGLRRRSACMLSRETKVCAAPPLAHSARHSRCPGFTAWHVATGIAALPACFDDAVCGDQVRRGLRSDGDMRGGGCPRRHTSAWKTLLRLQRDPVSTSLMGQAQLVAASIRPGNRSHELLGRHQVAGHSCCTVVVSCEQALIAWQKYKFSATHALGLSLLSSLW